MEENKETTPVEEDNTTNEPISDQTSKEEESVKEEEQPEPTETQESEEPKEEQKEETQEESNVEEEKEEPEVEEKETNTETSEEETTETQKAETSTEPQTTAEAQTTLDQEPKPSDQEEEAKSSKFVVGFIVGLIIIIALIAGVRYIYSPTPEPETISPAVVADFDYPTQDARTEFTYNGFEFKKADDMWSTEIKKGKTVYNIEFYYSPTELEDIPFTGEFGEAFQEEKVYVTFDPNDENLTFIALSIAQLDTSLVRSFGKGIVAACANKDAEACLTVPIITCDSNVTEVVFFFKESNETRVDIVDNCVTINGKEWDMVKATEALLMRGYTIIK